MPRDTAGHEIVREHRKAQLADAPSGWNVIDPRDLIDPPPPRKWIVEDWLPVGCVTANYGDGGIGKTLLAQLLQTSCTAGIPWGGLAVQQCNSIGLYCEDDNDELHRRQIQACDAFGLEMGRLSGMRWISGYGQENTLVEIDNGIVTKISRLMLLEEHIEKQGAELVVLDTAADLFPGNENDRSQVRQFIGHLNGIAYRKQCAILLNAHPSRAGLASGNLDGASTAWNNSVRSRWSLARADGDDADPNERILTRRKANYAAVGDTLRLRWQNGVLVPLEALTGLNALAGQAHADAVFLELLAATLKDGRPVSDRSRAGNFAPKEFSKRTNRQGLTQRDFNAAMERLFAAGKIVTVEYGRPSASGRPSRIEPAQAPS